LISASPIDAPDPMTSSGCRRADRWPSVPADELHGSYGTGAAFEDGFQITVSPHTMAIKAFQAHTATGN
jgi:hypothetical protein